MRVTVFGSVCGAWGTLDQGEGKSMEHLQESTRWYQDQVPSLDEILATMKKRVFYCVFFFIKMKEGSCKGTRPIFFEY